MTVANFFIVPSGVNVTEFACRSGNVYVPTNNLLTNVAPGDILDVISMGARQVAGPDSGANLAWVASRFYGLPNGSTPATLLLVASTIYAFPLRLPANVPLQTLGINVATGQTGGLVRGAIYTDLKGAPNALVAGTDTGSLTATGTALETFTPTNPLTLTEGWYWLAVQGSASSVMPTVSAVAAGYGSDTNAALGSDTAAHLVATSAEAAMGVSGTATFGAMPTTFPTPTLVQNAAVPMLILGT